MHDTDSGIADDDDGVTFPLCAGALVGACWRKIDRLQLGRFDGVVLAAPSRYPPRQIKSVPANPRPATLVMKDCGSREDADGIPRPRQCVLCNETINTLLTYVPNNNSQMMLSYAFLERDSSVTTGTGDDGRRAYSSTPAYYHTLAETTVAAC